MSAVPRLALLAAGAAVALVVAVTLTTSSSEDDGGQRELQAVAARYEHAVRDGDRDAVCRLFLPERRAACLRDPGRAARSRVFVSPPRPQGDHRAVTNVRQTETTSLGTAAAEVVLHFTRRGDRWYIDTDRERRASAP